MVLNQDYLPLPIPPSSNKTKAKVLVKPKEL
jgi:hypothetical protein